MNAFLEPEFGVSTAIHPPGVKFSTRVPVDSAAVYFWMPFGLRLVAPLVRDRIELSGGEGGLCESYAVANPNPAARPSRSGWGGYVVASAAVALDPGRHVWLSVSPRYYVVNPAAYRDRWLQVYADLSLGWGARR